MKKLFLSAALFCLIGQFAEAQEIRLNGYASYVFDDRFDTYYSNTSYLNGKILGGLQWGGGLEYMMNPDYGIEISYLRQDTKVPVSYYRLGEINRRLDAGINYIMLGGARYAGNDRAQGYGGLSLGAVIYSNKNPEQGEPKSVTKFAWGARLGGILWATENVGLKIQAQLLSAVQALGGGFYFGTGGVGAGVSTYSTLFQFGLGGGIAIRFGESY